MTSLLGLGMVAASLGAVVLIALLSWPVEPRRFSLAEEKSFGWFDPHLHLSVVDVGKSSLPSQKESGDEIEYAVTLAVRNSGAAPDFVIDPSPLRLSIRDAGGAIYPPHSSPESPRGRLERPARAGESYQQVVRFRVPETIGEPELWVVGDLGVGRVIPFFSRSVLFHKLVFDLE